MTLISVAEWLIVAAWILTVLLSQILTELLSRILTVRIFLTEFSSLLKSSFDLFLTVILVFFSMNAGCSFSPLWLAHSAFLSVAHSALLSVAHLALLSVAHSAFILILMELSILALRSTLVGFSASAMHSVMSAL